MPFGSSFAGKIRGAGRFGTAQVGLELYLHDHPQQVDGGGMGTGHAGGCGGRALLVAGAGGNVLEVEDLLDRPTEELTDSERQREARIVPGVLDRVDGLAGNAQALRELGLRPPSLRA